MIIFFILFIQTLRKNCVSVFAVIRRTRATPNTDSFHAVKDMFVSLERLNKARVINDLIRIISLKSKHFLKHTSLYPPNTANISCIIVREITFQVLSLMFIRSLIFKCSLT